MENVFFIPFPKPKTQRDKCERWIRLCGRKYFSVDNIKKETYICSKHFVGIKGPTNAHPDPLPALATNFERNLLLSKRKRKSPLKRCNQPGRSKRKKLLFNLAEDMADADYSDNDQSENTQNSLPNHSVHSDHCYSQTNNTSTEPEQAPPSPANLVESALEITDNKRLQDAGDYEIIDTTLEVEECLIMTAGLTQTTQTVSAPQTDMGVQTDISFDDLAEYSNSELQDKKKLQRNLFMSYILKDDESCKCYTGLNLAVFSMLFSWLRSRAEKMNYWRGQDTTDAKANAKPNPGPPRKLTIKEEFILVLIRLRRGFDVDVLSDIFGLHSSNISRIFTTGINFLYLELKFLIAWPSKEQVKTNLPKQFKHFPKTRVIIDCTEFFIQIPSLPSSQRVTWSQYKHHNTFKSLIGISPSGAFTFVSKLRAAYLTEE